MEKVQLQVDNSRPRELDGGEVDEGPSFRVRDAPARQCAWLKVVGLLIVEILLDRKILDLPGLVDELGV